MGQPTAPAQRRQPSLAELSAPLARMGQGMRDELGLAMARFHEQLEAAGDELMLFGLAEPNYRARLFELLERELDLALHSVRNSQNGQRTNRDDLLSAVEASDDLSLYAVDHPRAALRDAAGELAEMRKEMGLKAIAAQLTKEKIAPPQGGAWTHQKVFRCWDRELEIRRGEWPPK